MQLRSKFTKVGSKFIKFFYLATEQASAGRDEVGEDVDVLRRPATEAKILMPLLGTQILIFNQKRSFTRSENEADTHVKAIEWESDAISNPSIPFKVITGEFWVTKKIKIIVMTSCQCQTTDLDRLIRVTFSQYRSSDISHS